VPEPEAVKVTNGGAVGVDGCAEKLPHEAKIIVPIKDKNTRRNFIRYPSCFGVLFLCSGR
jgi:hypothetical protein